MRDSDSSLPVLPSPDILEVLRTGLNTPPTTPQHSPHAFLKEDRWLFSPPPVLTVASTRLDNFRTEFSATPHDTEKWKKSPVLRKKATHPASLVLPMEEHPPRKRIKPTTVATLLDHNSQGTLEPSTTIGIEYFEVPPPPFFFASQTSYVASRYRTNFLETTTFAADCVTSHPRFGEKTHHLTCIICKLSGLPDI